MGPEWWPGLENRPPGMPWPFSRLWDRSCGPKPVKMVRNRNIGLSGRLSGSRAQVLLRKASQFSIVDFPIMPNSRWIMSGCVGRVNPTATPRTHMYFQLCGGVRWLENLSARTRERPSLARAGPGLARRLPGPGQGWLSVEGLPSRAQFNDF